MMHIIIDIETKSSANIKNVGLRKYIEDSEFAILLLGYIMITDTGEELLRGVIDLYNYSDEAETELAILMNRIKEPDTVLHAFNVDFEQTALLKAFPEYKDELSRHKWHDIQVDAMQLGLPSGLDKVAKVLGLGSKLYIGKEGIRNFCTPRGPGYDTPYHNLSGGLQESWLQFIEYCMRDVELETEILLRLNPMLQLNATPAEREIELVSSRINDRGVRVDIELATWLRDVHTHAMEIGKEALKELTGLENPNSNVQFSSWLNMLGCRVSSVDKETLLKLKNNDSTNPLAIEGIEARLSLSSSIPKKYSAAVDISLNDGRMRGLFKYYGANRTGRWTSTGYQLHNLARTDNAIGNKLRKIYKEYKLPADGYPKVVELAEKVNKPIATVIGQCVRSILIPNRGNTFIIADYSAIEARVAAWLADEEWVLDIFRTDGRVYERTASKMFNVPVEEVTPGSVMRRKGKYAVLALGYGGGTNALERFGAGKDMTFEEMEDLVAAWRSTNDNIVKLWKQLEIGFRKALADPGVRIVVNDKLYFCFDYELDFMKLGLPSGRYLAYYEPRYESKSITYLSSVLGASGVRDSTYGGKLMENVCQAVARDLLGDYMVRLDNELDTAKVVMHIHDEVVVECPGTFDVCQEVLSKVEVLGSEGPEWAEGLPLNVEAFTSDEYTK